VGHRFFCLKFYKILWSKWLCVCVCNYMCVRETSTCILVFIVTNEKFMGGFACEAFHVRVSQGPAAVVYFQQNKKRRRSKVNNVTLKL
jgi:hypothetical protein